ncbi:MAG: hypothetical protein RI553_07170, partial [Salibaculum sp.]
MTPRHLEPVDLPGCFDAFCDHPQAQVRGQIYRGADDGGFAVAVGQFGDEAAVKLDLLDCASSDNLGHQSVLSFGGS